MSYIGSSATPLPVNFSAVQSQGFNGTGSQTTFTLNRSVGSVAAVEVLVNNVQQSPYDGSYNIAGGTSLVFSEAPSAGTNNVYVVYRDQALGSLTDTGAVRKTGDTVTGDFGVGATPSARLHATKAGAEVARFTNSQSNGGDWEFKIGGGGFEDRKFMLTDKFGGSDNVRLSLDASGRVTMPYQPAFSVTRNSGNIAAGTTFIGNVENVNTGGHYNTSTGRFTAPVAGVYEFSVFFMGEQTSTDVPVAMLIRKNGVATTARVNPYTRTTGATFVGMAGTCLISLAAGDWVDAWNDGNVPIYGIGSGHNHFSGYLVG